MGTIFRTFFWASAMLCWTTAEAQCLTIPAQSESPLAVACETEENYTFDIVGVHYAFSKALFRERLRAEFATWSISAALPVPDDAQIEFWLAVPEANPAATQGRAVLRSASINIVWYLSLDPDSWAIGNEQLGILDAAPYPVSYGHRPAQLLIKGKGPDEDERRDLLAEFGARDATPYAPNWSVYATDPGRESAIATAIRHDARTSSLIERVEQNHIVEWIALRELAFTFAYSER